MQRILYFLLLIFMSCTSDKLEPNIEGVWSVQGEHNETIWEFTAKEVKVFTIDCKLLSEGSYYLQDGNFYRTPHVPVDYYFDGRFEGDLILIRPSGERMEFREGSRCNTID